MYYFAKGVTHIYRRVSLNILKVQSIKNFNNMVTYEEVKDIINHPDKYLIDVRNQDELQKSGQIPASIGIPLSNLGEALNFSETDFKNAYSRDKPKINSEVIFTCLAGGRAEKAANLAKNLGFTNIKFYKGSWTEWAEKECLPK